MEAIFGFISKDSTKAHFMFLFKVLFTILFSLAIYLMIFKKLTIKLDLATTFISIKKGTFFIGIIIYIFTWHFFYYFLLWVITIIITNIQYKIYLFIKKEKINDVNILDSFLNLRNTIVFKFAEKFRFFKIKENQIVLDINHAIIEKYLNEAKSDPSNIDISYPLESIVLTLQFLFLYIFWIQMLNEIPFYFSAITISVSIIYIIVLFIVCIIGLFFKLHTVSIMKYYESIKIRPIQ